MLISEILSKLQELRSQFYTLQRKYKKIPTDYADLEVFSEAWDDFVCDVTAFEISKEPYEYGSLNYLLKPSKEQDLMLQFMKDNPEVDTQFRKDILHRTGAESLEEFVADHLRATEIYKQINKLASEHSLHQISFEVDLFLGLETVYYESSRC